MARSASQTVAGIISLPTPHLKTRRTRFVCLFTSLRHRPFSMKACRSSINRFGPNCSAGVNPNWSLIGRNAYRNATNSLESDVTIRGEFPKGQDQFIDRQMSRHVCIGLRRLPKEYQSPILNDGVIGSESTEVDIAAGSRGTRHSYHCLACARMVSVTGNDGFRARHGGVLHAAIAFARIPGN